MSNAVRIIDTMQEQPKPSMWQRAKGFVQQKTYQVATVGAVGITAMSSANAADFTLDTTSIIAAIGVTLAAVTAVALSAVTIPLVIKGVKYVKAAF